MTDITEMCDYCNNYFLKDYIELSDIYTGDFTISGHGFVSPDFTLKSGQYFRVKGSDLNDGVYCNTQESLNTLKDEEFTGQVWLMSVPRAFVALCDKIAEWQTANMAVTSPNMSPYTSETVQGVYSYSKGSTGSNSGGSAVSWQAQFSGLLNPYRRIREL